jgi:O-antigen/teichoic acid export membrane protein
MDRSARAMTDKPLTDEAVNNVAWQAAVTGSSLILKAGLLILLARNIPPTQFGLIAAATVITSLATDFSQMGVHRALVQRLSLLPDHIKSAFAISLITGAIAAFGIYLAAPFFAGVFRIEESEQFIRFLAATLLFTGIAAVSASLLQRERRFRALGLLDLGSYLLGFGLVALPMAIAGYGAWALAIGQMVQIVSRTLALLAVRRPAFALIPRVQESKELLRTGLGFSAGQVGNFVATQVDYFVVGRYLGAEALGFYNRAYQFLLLPAQLFGTVTSTVLFPTIATIQDQPERVARAYLRALGLIAMLTLPVSGALAILAPELVGFLLGNEWTGMIVPFQFLVVTLIFRTSYKISDAVTLAMGSMYRRALRQFVYAAAVAGGAYIGSAYGLGAVAVGVGAAVVLNYVLMLNLAREVTGLALIPVLAVQARQFAASAVIVAPLWAAAVAARSYGFSDFAVLLAAGFAGVAVTATTWLKFRGLFGPEGEWLQALAERRLAKFRAKRAG